MNHLLNNPSGIDRPITAIQEELYNLLTPKWNGTIDGYGRIYKNQTSSGVLPEHYKGSGDFKSVLYNDKIAGHFFFTDNDSHRTNDGLLYIATVKCVFMVDLPDIITGNDVRNDAQAHLDVVNILREIQGNRYKIEGLETGIRTVMAGFNIENILLDNMHPKHIFAVKMTLPYYLEC